MRPGFSSGAIRDAVGDFDTYCDPDIALAIRSDRGNSPSLVPEMMMQDVEVQIL